ncbi:MAG: carboxy terminal-processing peptidase [Chitinophagaceae bacterium]
MKIRLAFVIIFLAFSFLNHAQLPPLQQKAIHMKRMIGLKHYSPRMVNDSFSWAVFKMMIEETDPRRIFFTAAEFRQLQSFSFSLDDELQGKGWGFIDQFSSVYKNALLRADTIAEKALKKPFDFSVNETITSSREDDFNFAADRPALESRWSRRLKFHIMNRIYEASSSDSIKKNSFKEALVSIEASTREKVKLGEKKNIKNVLNFAGGYDVFISSLYLNAIASCFDPHTNYFSPQGKEDFQAQLSTESFSFGIELEENDKGQVVIDKLVPGGPAWKSGELHEGDELLSLQWEGKEAVDMSGATMEDVYEVLDQSSHERMVFKFRKTDGATAIVLLRKEKIENDENIVKGFLLKGEKKIGYILLPGFYTEWGNESGSGCANDVAKAIIRLKKENIDGLILDVRYNGGGSVGEALEMAGIFIDEGPLSSEKNKDGKQITLKDPNRGTIYDGPLALMVNGQSASASELLAATLQDYNRAVIIGSDTYGKATAQRMFSIDTISTEAMPAENKEMVKITIAKLYRLSGGSAQFTGVLPDVILPDAFDALEFREKFSKYALTPDTGKKNNYYKPLPSIPVSELVKRSAARVVASEAFNEIKKFIEEGKKKYSAKTRTIPLKWDQFEIWMKENEKMERILNEDELPTKKFTVENHAGDKDSFRNNAYAREVNDVLLKNISGDIYIDEAFSVLLDLILLQKSN